MACALTMQLLVQKFPKSQAGNDHALAAISPQM
jgi:hypothetical protein